MNRLHLRIYEPPQAAPESDKQASEAADILPFEPRSRTIISGRMTTPVDRARVIHENSSCPECSKTDVSPVELQDATISPKSRLPIPGTATIVGFHCNACGTEWPIYELTVRRNG